MFHHVKKREEDVLHSKTFFRIATHFNLSQKRVLDLGCGYGEYMQRFGPDSLGITTTPEEVTYGKTVKRDIRFGNVESLDSVLDINEKFDVIWCNNILEHLLSPHSFLVSLKKFSHDDTELLLGTPMIPFPSQLMRVKKFRGALASPHINFFTKKTYECTLRFAGWKVLDNRPFISSIHMLDTLLAPAAPHLYIHCKNNQNYKYPPKKLHEWENDPKYSSLIQIMNG